MPVFVGIGRGSETAYYKNGSGNMKIKKELLQAFLDKYKITAAILAQEMGVNAAEIETLLNGGAVCEETARRFIYYFGADEAAKMIDWAAIGKQNPQDGE